MPWAGLRRYLEHSVRGGYGELGTYLRAPLMGAGAVIVCFSRSLLAAGHLELGTSQVARRYCSLFSIA